MDKKYEDLFYSSGVLINKFNINNKENLEIEEERCSFFKVAKLCFVDEMNRCFGIKFDHEHLNKIHKYLLGDVYTWAGEYKKFSLYKGQDILDGKSVNYSPVEYLKSNLDYVFSELNNTKWNLLSKREQVLKFADLYQYLWQCHPFNEGNTRTTSMFMYHFTKVHDIPVNFKKLFKDSITLRNSFVLYATGFGDKQMNDLFISCIVE